jgi:Uma2 family endonuclease
MQAFTARRSTSSAPLLENGMRMKWSEFERRWDAMPELKRAELLEGVVHAPSPVTTDDHGEPHSDLLTFAGVYKAATPGVRSAGNATIRLNDANAPQPDAALFIDPAHGGQARIVRKYLTGGPEWLAEVSASTTDLDLTTKFEIYRRFGVQEYVVWRVLDKVIDWFILKAGQYVPLKLTRAGLFKSKVLPGLWLDAAALVRGDLSRVLKVLAQGLRSPQHKAFVARLKKAKKRRSATPRRGEPAGGQP